MTDLPHLPSIDDPNIYLDVLTHSSLVHAGTIPNEDYGDNTRLQELGESALTLAVTDRLFSLRPMLPSQDIVAKKQEYLSDENIDNWVQAYGLKSRLESKVLLHTYIGAVYYKKGLGPIAEWVKRIVEQYAPMRAANTFTCGLMPDSAPLTSGKELFEEEDREGVEEDELPKVLPLPVKAAVPDAGLEAAYLATVEASALYSNDY
ncbi:hypothetical protein HWV62_31807 [Athelia sp. TMB]|nr:hypothetical protein HWV62_31807 [Athelia sp. TMB]